MTRSGLGKLVELHESVEEDARKDLESEIAKLESEIAELADKLRIHRRSEIDDVSDATDPTARINLWREFFLNLGDLRAVSPSRVWHLFAYHPGPIATSFRLRKSDSGSWRTLTEQYEAWYMLAAGNAMPFIVGWDATQGAAHLARTRWQLLSVPFRPECASLIEPAHRRSAGSSIERARQAREQWLAVLSEIDSHQTLKLKIDFETEAALVASVEISTRALGAVTPDPAVTQRDDDGRNRLRDKQSCEPSTDPNRNPIAGYAVTRLLLPRFAWCRSWAVVREMQGRWLPAHWFGTAAIFAIALVAFLLAAVGVVDGWGYTVAAWIALVGYASIAVGAALRRELGWLWLLRQPASSAVGLLTLAALPADWWATSDKDAASVLTKMNVDQWTASDGGAVFLATGILIAVGLAYLMIEAANHGAAGRALLGRALGVGVFGLVHAAMVSLIGLRFILPAFASSAHGKEISCWWTAMGCGNEALSPWLMVLAATAWSFVAGVFLQILWDDQPITAPLTHVAWKVSP